MDRVKKAEAMFQKGYSCSQAILAVYGSELGLERSDAIRIAAPFSGGIAHMGELCGAASGALLVLGLRHGEPRPSLKRSKERVNAACRSYLERFQERRGTLRCVDILGCDPRTADSVLPEIPPLEDRAYCQGVVREAAELLEEML